MQNAVREIYVDPTVADYIVRLVDGDADHPDVYLGASPRGSIALYRAGQALAGLLGSRLRHPGRHQGPRRAGPGPPPDHQDELVDPRRPARQVVRELLESTPIDGIRPTGGPNGPRHDQPHARARPAPEPRDAANRASDPEQDR